MNKHIQKKDESINRNKVRKYDRDEQGMRQNKNIQKKKSENRKESARAKQREINKKLG